MKSLIVALLMSLAPVLNLYAQQATAVSQPFFGFSQHPDCGESVMITGTIYGFIQTKTLRDGSISILSNLGPRNDVKAIGIESGNQYNVVGHTNINTDTSRDGTLEGLLYTNTFNVIGLYKLHSTLKITFPPGEEPKVFVDNFRVTCK